MSFELRRLGVLMEPQADAPYEVEGILNPAAIRGDDGHLYLFPRMVGQGNYSRVGVARVVFDGDGNPTGAERLGIALEPTAEYEHVGDGRAGCEDPRVSYLEPLGHYVMAYAALTPQGPRIAVAKSDDLCSWERINLVRFEPYDGIAMTGINDKDAAIFPEAVRDPGGISSVALLHRPMFDLSEPLAPGSDSREGDIDVESIWLSYWHLTPEGLTPEGRQFVAHRRLAGPQFDWEDAKIGVGAPPVRCRHGWLLVYHGVQKTTEVARGLIYRAGVMILDGDNPHKVLYRSSVPILSPETEAETHGAVDAVVFPSGIDRRDDIGDPDRFDIYYGMADRRIGVASLRVPAELPADGRTG